VDAQPLIRLDAPAPKNESEELRRISRELEGVFLRQLLQAMRATIPEGGFCESSTGREVFNSLLDEQLASLAAQRMQKGIGEALYRQLCRSLTASSDRATE
jgi:flagellar protein FlgJ